MSQSLPKEVLKDYEEEAEYFDEQHPVTKNGTEDFTDGLASGLGKARGILGKIVDVRDKLYGYDKPGAKDAAAKRYKNMDMEFLPSFGGGSNPFDNPFGVQEQKKRPHQKNNEKKKGGDSKEIHIHIHK